MVSGEVHSVVPGGDDLTGMVADTPGGWEPCWRGRLAFPLSRVRSIPPKRRGWQPFGAEDPEPEIIGRNSLSLRGDPVWRRPASPQAAAERRPGPVRRHLLAVCLAGTALVTMAALLHAPAAPSASPSIPAAAAPHPVGGAAGITAPPQTP